MHGPDGRLLSEWVPPGEPTEVGMGPIFIAAAPDGTIYASVQMLDTIHKLKVVTKEGEPLGGPVEASGGASPSVEPAHASPAPSPDAAILTVPVDEFAVPFSIDLPQGGWGVREVGATSFQVGASQPASGGDRARVHAFVVDDVFPDPCNPGSSLMDPPVGPSVDDLVHALGQLAGFRVIDMSDVEIDGHAGKAIDLENSLDVTECQADPWLPQWTYSGNGGQPIEHGPPSGTYQRIIVLDVDGQRVVLETWMFPYTLRETVAEAEQVLESIDFH